MMMAGLGIDFGSPEQPPPHQQVPHRKRTLSHQSKALPPHPHHPQAAASSRRPKPGHQHPKRPSTAGGRLPSPQRRVRIASGQPGVLGHGAGHTTDEDLFSSPESTDSYGQPPSFGLGAQALHQSLIDPRVNPRTALVRSSVGSGYLSSSSGGGGGNSSSSPSDSVFDSDFNSPGTQTSATSYASSQQSNGLQRSFTLRKLASQPNLSRTATLKQPQQQPSQPAPVRPSDEPSITRTQSSSSLSNKASDSGASLGRSSEIRNSTRGPSLRGGARGATSLRGRGTGRVVSNGARALHNKTQSWDGGPIPVLQGQGPRPAAASTDSPAPTANEQGMIPDGFGGYKYPDKKDDNPAEAPTDEHSSPSRPSPIVESSPEFPVERQGSLPRPQQSEQADTAPVDLQEMAPQELHHQPTAPLQIRNRSSRADSVISDSSQASSGYTAGSHPRQALRVGTFYGTDGQEAARLDATGRLSRVSPERPGHDQRRSYDVGKVHHTTSPQKMRPRSMSAAPSAAHMAGPPNPQPVRQEHDEDRPLNERQGADVIKMRSIRGFKGLEGAEYGEAMVAFDQSIAQGDRFAIGQPILPGQHGLADEASLLESAHLDHAGERQWQQPGGGGAQRSALAEDLSGNKLPEGKQLAHSRSAGHLRPQTHGRNNSEASVSSNGTLASLERNGTLLNPTANPARRSRDLHRLLGNSSRKAPATAASESDRSSRASSPVKGAGGTLHRTNTMSTTVDDSPAVLEKGRPNKARVDIDLLLESDLVVEGGMLRGRIELQIKKQNDGEGAVLMAHPKVRVVGFEELTGDDTRHIFYHHATIVDGDKHPGGSQPFVLHGSPTLSSPEAEGRAPLACFASQPDHEGYSVGREGSHSIPFSLEMPIGKGAKGSYRGKNAVVRYIVIGSVKLKNAQGGNRSIAHFYRHIDLFPYFNPAVALSSAPRAIQASAEKGLFMGGSGKLRVSASLHRGTWVAGQRAYINVSVHNQTSKRVKNACFTLIRTVTLYRPRPELNMGSTSAEGYIDPDACNTQTSRKKVTEEVLEMGQKGSKSVVTARGWWTGVEAGSDLEFSHHLTIPSDALTISRGRHVEISYAVRVSVGGSMSADVSVELPLRVINFLSLDPPPLKASNSKSTALTRGWSGPINNTRSSVFSDEAPMIAAVKSADALRSPGRVEVGRTQPNIPSGPPSHLLALQQRAAQRNGLQPPEDPSRKMQHQKSLDFINHAIRSATARRNSNQKPGEDLPMGLGIEVSDDDAVRSSEQDDEEATPTGSTVSSFAASSDRGGSVASGVSGRRSTSREGMHPSCMPYEHIDVPAPSFGFPFVQLPAVSVDDAGDDFDEEDANKTLGLNDDSVDELDMVVGSTRLEGEGFPGFAQMAITGEHDETLDADLSTGTITTDMTTDGYEEGESGRPQSRGGQPGEELSQPAPNGNRPAVVVDAATPERKPVQQKGPRVSAVRSPVKATGPRASSVVPKVSNEALRHSVSNQALRQKGSASNLQSSTSSSPGKNGFTPRQLAPSKEAPSPSKPALKSKSSFTFATSDAPLRISPAGASEASKEVVRAKADQTQFVGSIQTAAGSPKRSRPLPKEPTVISVPSPKKSPRKQSVDDDAASSSPESMTEALTPESAKGDFGTEGDVRIVDETGLSGPGGLGLVLEEASPDMKALESKNTSTVSTLETPPRVRREASAEPAAPVSSQSPANSKTIRHSASTASLTGDRLQRSHSNHNIRGANVIVPSVRSKIAALENRQQALKDFTRPASRSFTREASNSPVNTPNRGSRAGTPSSEARGSNQPSSPSTSRLSRKMSNLSMSSDASGATSSTAHQWMRRDSIASNVSFKAPMLRK